MDILGNIMGSAKQLAQNAIFEKLEARAGSPDHPLLNMIRDTFQDLPEESRKELFAVFSQLFETYQASPDFDFEKIWKEIASQKVIQDLAVGVTKKLVTNLIRADH